MADEKAPASKYSPFHRFPEELVLQISKQLEDKKDQVSLASVCWRFRLLLGEEFLSKAILTNSESSGKLVLALSKSKTNNLVKELWYEGWAATDKEDAYQHTWDAMPSSVANVLSNLKRFPNLKKVSIGFDFKLAEENWTKKLCDMWECLDSDGCLEGEVNFAWRATMARTLEALIACKLEELDTLEFREVVPIFVSTYWNPVWRRWLSKVKNFEISMWGGSLAGDKILNNNTGYTHFVRNLDWSYFYRITNVTSLKFRASEYAMVYGRSMQSFLWNGMAFSLDGSMMRKLKSLTLQNIFLSAELIDFASSHLGTLESIVLEECYSYVEDGENKHRVGPAWRELFDALSDARAPRLKKFSIEAPAVPEIVTGEEQTEDNKRAEEVKEILAKEPDKRVFPYGWLADASGRLEHSWAFMLEHLRSGRDREAYDKLMGVVAANRLDMPWRMARLASKYQGAMPMLSTRPAAVWESTPRQQYG